MVQQALEKAKASPHVPMSTQGTNLIRKDKFALGYGHWGWD